MGSPARAIATRLRDSPTLSARPSAKATHPVARPVRRATPSPGAPRRRAQRAGEPRPRGPHRAGRWSRQCRQNWQSSRTGATCRNITDPSAGAQSRIRDGDSSLEPRAPRDVDDRPGPRRHGQPVDHDDVVRMQGCGVDVQPSVEPAAGTPVERHVCPLERQSPCREAVHHHRRHVAGDGTCAELGKRCLQRAATWRGGGGRPVLSPAPRRRRGGRARGHPIAAGGGRRRRCSRRRAGPRYGAASVSRRRACRSPSLLRQGNRRSCGQPARQAAWRTSQRVSTGSHTGGRARHKGP